jgi:signal transduction histidine kinase
MLLLLGDQLIRDAGLAVFELVKNAYDADATSCVVTMHNIADPSKASIAIEDDGVGMDRETVTGVWLEPGTDYRDKQRKEKRRSLRFKRLPLGEKGVGRFAVHKLGEVIELVTRQRNEDEIVVRINWADFTRDKYLSEVPVSVETRAPKLFTGRKTGTRIQVTQLRDKKWTRGKVRDLQRAVTSLCSPFGEPDDFRASLALEPASDWLEGLLDMKTVLHQSLFRASGYIRGSQLTYDYEFRPLKAMRERIEGRKVKAKPQTITRPRGKGDEGQVLDLSQWEIGEVRFDLHIFDRDPAVLELSTSDRAGLKKFLDQNGGIRVYRDGVRVFDFGEAGNDWLDLGGRRVNIPTVRVSNNQVLGAITLRAEESQDLIEKTNREGFIENDAYEALADAVLFAVTQVEAERKIDKKRLREQYSRTKYKEPVLEDLTELREEIDKRNLTPELGKYINRIESQFTEVRNTLLTAAGAGLTLTTVIHEVEKIIKELVTALKRDASHQKIVDLVHHLAEMVDGLGFLVKKSGKATEKASVLIAQALFNTEYRLKAHKIRATNGVMQANDPEFSVKCVRRLIVATLANLIDNSIYWLENRGAPDRQIYLGTTFEFAGKPALVVADNGPGFTDAPEYLVEPFFSRKPDGMGLGLHLANEVAKVHGGRLVFPDRDEITLPKQFTGAIVALEFPDHK